MKTIRIILSLILAAMLFACEEKNVFPDQQKHPVKAIDIEINIDYGLQALSDGSVVTLADVGAYPETYFDSRACLLAKIERNGKVTLSQDTVLMWNSEANSTYNQWFVTNYDDIFVYNGISGSKLYPDQFSVTKFNQNCGLIYETHRSNKNMLDSKYFCFPLDNGEFAIYLSQELGLLDCNGIIKNFRYSLENNANLNEETLNNLKSCNNAISFEDKIIFYGGRHYLMFNTKGTFLYFGEMEWNIKTIKYLKGNLYVTSFGGLADSTATEDNGVYQWFITKLDDIGNKIFTTKIINCMLMDNFSIYGDMLFATGFVVTDIEKEESHGAIYIIDNNNGSINGNDTISMDYVDCEILPLVISPDSHGEYDVFAIRRQSYDDWTDYKKDNTATMTNGKLFIYHTDDLHKLQIK